MRFLSAEFVKGITALTYWVGLPCLLFYKVAEAPYDYNIAGKTFLVVLISIIVCIVIAYAVMLLVRPPAASIGAFVQGAFRGNLLYVGLPVIIYSFSNGDSFEAAKIETVAILVLALIVPVHNIAAIIVLLAGQGKLDRHIFPKIIRRTITNPLFLACGIGIIYSLTFPKLPTAVFRTCYAIGQMALPLALLSIGASLAQEKITGQLKLAFAASTIKVAIAPAVGYFCACLLNLGTGETKIALILLTCPTAAISYVLVKELNGDEQLSAAIVAISSIMALVSISIVIGLF